MESDSNAGASAHGDLLEMSVANMSFLIDRLYEDCSPLQFLRELTRNSIESIQRSGEDSGEIRWDIDLNRLLLTEGQVFKLCIVDTGVGMTGDEMVRYINQLSSSIHKQSKTGNFGVGAKISAAPSNKRGLVYLSWVDGVGYMIHLMLHPNGKYGLMRFDNGEFWQYVDDSIKPEPIDQHGTMVVLLGNDDYENTMEPPPNVRMPRKWILRYLNSRFFRFPEGITVKTREGWDLPKTDKHNFLRTVTGMQSWLESSSDWFGTVRLDENHATAYWYIVSADTDTNSGHYTPPGHVAALYQDELYESVVGNAGYARLQSFGVIFGCERVVIYVEPDNGSSQQVSANTARTHLMIDNEPLNWSAYAYEFRDQMPDELVAFQDKVGQNAKHSDHRSAIRERLKTIKELFKFGRYRPNPKGEFRIENPSENTGGQSGKRGSSKSGNASSGGLGGLRGDIYSLFTAEHGDPAEYVPFSVEPEVAWVSVADGSRAKDELEDRAAKYLIETNVIKVNADFRAFTDMVDRWVSRYNHVPGCLSTVEQVVREWFEQQLVETVMSAHALKKAGKWSTEEVTHLWDENALTAAVLPRYHIDINIKRSLGQKLGKLGTAA